MDAAKIRKLTSSSREMLARAKILAEQAERHKEGSKERERLTAEAEAWVEQAQKIASTALEFAKK